MKYPSKPQAENAFETSSRRLNKQFDRGFGMPSGARRSTPVPPTDKIVLRMVRRRNHESRKCLKTIILGVSASRCQRECRRFESVHPLFDPRCQMVPGVVFGRQVFARQGVRWIRAVGEWDRFLLGLCQILPRNDSSGRLHTAHALARSAKSRILVHVLSGVDFAA